MVELNFSVWSLMRQRLSLFRVIIEFKVVSKPAKKQHFHTEKAILNYFMFIASLNKK